LSFTKANKINNFLLIGRNICYYKYRYFYLKIMDKLEEVKAE